MVHMLSEAQSDPGHLLLDDVFQAACRLLDHFRVREIAFQVYLRRD